MFVLSKVFLFLIAPGFWIPALLLTGCTLLWTRWRRAGRAVLTATVFLLIALSVIPVGHFLLGPLENRFPTRQDIDRPVNGIVVLGGTIMQFMTADRGQPSLTDGAERLTEFVRLARVHPEAKLVFTGGSGRPFRQEIKEADTARRFFADMGLDTARIVFESESRNTLENAQLSYQLVRPGPTERWMLVTSATHMPRAMGVFRKAGWNPIAYPVDYRTTKEFEWSPGFNMLGGLESLHDALYEWFALAAYRCLGRTDALFPAPEEHPS